MMRAVRALAIIALLMLLAAFLGTFIYLVHTESQREDDEWLD